MATIVNSSKKMSILRSSDFVLDSLADIGNHVLNFYNSLYATENSCIQNNWIEKVIPSIAIVSGNAMLTNLPSFEEVKDDVFSMNGYGTPGPDGFGGSFYHAFWDIIGKDVFNSVLQFFSAKLIAS